MLGEFIVNNSARFLPVMFALDFLSQLHHFVKWKKIMIMQKSNSTTEQGTLSKTWYCRIDLGATLLFCFFQWHLPQPPLKWTIPSQLTRATARDDVHVAVRTAARCSGSWPQVRVQFLETQAETFGTICLALMLLTFGLFSGNVFFVLLPNHEILTALDLILLMLLFPFSWG